MPVTCYICGRDFGTRSIGIHIPNCQKKWDNEQEKLPKSQRRDLPKPPEDFDKVLSGEIKGKALQKMNNKAFEDYNDTALMPCEHCGRTFLPKSLESHQKLCTEHNPMTKPAKSKSYSGQAKARVKYPSIKPKSSAKKVNGKKQEPEKIDLPPINSSSSSRDNSPSQDAVSEPVTDDEDDDDVHESVPAQINIAIVQQMDQQEDTEDNSDKSNRSSIVESETSSISGGELSDTVSSPADPLPESNAPQPQPQETSIPLETEPQKSSEISPGDKTPEKLQTKKDKEPSNLKKSPCDPNKKSTPIKTSNSNKASNQSTSNPPDSSSNLTVHRPPSGRGPGTFKKRGTFTFNNQMCGKDALVALIQDSELLEDDEHATKVYGLIQEYFREVRTTQLRSLFSGSVFEEEENCVEALEILQEFVKLKTNNNQ